MGSILSVIRRGVVALDAVGIFTAFSALLNMILKVNPLQSLAFLSPILLRRRRKKRCFTNSTPLNFPHAFVKLVW